MATVKIDLNAKDNTGGAFNSVKSQLAGIGRSVGALATLEIGKKIIEGLGKLGSASGAASAQAGKNFASLSNALNGVAAEVGAAVFGNNDFIKSIKTLLAAVVPVVTTLVKGLVPVITAVATGFTNMFNALRPGIEFVLSYAIPILSRLGSVATIVGNAFQIASGYLTGNTEKVKKYREENAKLLKDLVAPITRAKVDLTPANVAKLEATGAKVGATPDKAKAVDAGKVANDRYNQLLKLREAGQLERAGIDELSVAYANYSIVLRNANASTEDRAEALGAVQAYDKLATDAAAKHTKELEDQAKALDTLAQRENNRVSSLAKLVKLEGAKASATDRQTLMNERGSLQSDLSTSKDAAERLNLSEQIAAIDDALKVEASDLQKSIGETLGNALYGGLSQAFTGDFSGLIGGWFKNIGNSIGKGFASITAEALKKTGIFIAFQSKLLLAYSKIMSIVSAALSTPWGWAAVAAGAIALGSLVRGFASTSRSTGGSSYVAASSFSTNTQQAFGRDRTPVTIIYNGPRFPDTNSPEFMRALEDGYNELVDNGQIRPQGS